MPGFDDGDSRLQQFSVHRLYISAGFFIIMSKLMKPRCKDQIFLKEIGL